MQVGCPQLVPNPPSIRVRDHGPSLQLLNSADPTMSFPTAVFSGKMPGFGQERGRITLFQSNQALLCHIQKHSALPSLFALKQFLCAVTKPPLTSLADNPRSSMTSLPEGIFPQLSNKCHFFCTISTLPGSSLQRVRHSSAPSHTKAHTVVKS